MTETPTISFAPSADDITMSEATQETSQSDYSQSSEDTLHPDSLDPVCIKILFKQMNGSHTDDVSHLHHQVLSHMRKLDPKLIIYDSEDQPIILSNTTTHFKKRFIYEPLPRRHFRLLGVTHQIHSHLTISKHKKELTTFLQKHKITLAPHDWDSLDVRDVGWFCNVHTFFHQREHLHSVLIKYITQANPSQHIPPFKLYVKTVTAGKPGSSRVSTRAVHLESRSKDILILRKLLQQTYSTIKGLPGHFIPSNLPHLDNKHLHRTYILQQNKYIDDHRNISIYGVTADQLLQKVTYNDKEGSIREHLRRSSVIKWISPTSSTEQDGKWHLSTTLHHYPLAVQTVHTLIIDQIDGSTSNTPTSDEVSLKTSATESTRSYLEVLTSSSNHFDVPKTIPISPTPPTYTVPPASSAPTTGSYVSSLATRTVSASNPSNPSDQFQQSLDRLRHDFEAFQQTIRAEFHQQLRTAMDEQSNKFHKAIAVLETTSEQLQSQINQQQEQLKQEIPLMIRTELQAFVEIIKNPSPPKPAKRPREDDELDSPPLTQDTSLVEELEIPTAMDTSISNQLP